MTMGSHLHLPQFTSGVKLETTWLSHEGGGDHEARPAPFREPENASFDFFLLLHADTRWSGIWLQQVVHRVRLGEVVPWSVVCFFQF